MPNLSIHHLSNCISSNKSISAHLTWIPHQCSCKFPANVSVNLTLCIHGRMVTGIISQAATCLKEHLSWNFIFPVNGRACWARQGQQMDSLVKIERTEARTVILEGRLNICLVSSEPCPVVSTFHKHLKWQLESNRVVLIFVCNNAMLWKTVGQEDHPTNMGNSVTMGEMGSLDGRYTLGRLLSTRA